MLAGMEMPGREIPALGKLFPDIDYLTSLERVFAAKRWLKEQTSTERPWIPCEHSVLDDSTIEAIERVFDSQKPKLPEVTLLETRMGLEVFAWLF